MARTNAKQLQQIEFHGDISLSFDIIAFTVLSSFLATAAMLFGSIPILIGSMVLAPTFDPLVAIPFGVLKRNGRLLLGGLWSSFALFTIAFVVCAATVLLSVSTELLIPRQGEVGLEMIEERLYVTWGSVLVAIAAGAGGALAYATERRIHLVGVVVALALLPALAAAAIGFFASPLSGWGGLYLFGVNYLGIIIAGVALLYLRAVIGKSEEQYEKKTEGAM